MDKEFTEGTRLERINLPLGRHVLVEIHRVSNIHYEISYNKDKRLIATITKHRGGSWSGTTTDRFYTRINAIRYAVLFNLLSGEWFGGGEVDW